MGTFICTMMDQNQTITELVNIEDKESESESEEDKTEKLQKRNFTLNFYRCLQFNTPAQGGKLMTSKFLKIITPPPEAIRSIV